MEQDSKIESLTEVVKDNYKNAEDAAIRRENALEEKMKENNNILLKNLYTMIKSGNPPGVSVEQYSSRDGGSKK